LRNEVSEDDVMFIVTRTDAPTYEQFMAVVDAYHGHGNPYASKPELYEIGDYPLDKVRDLAARLWYSGKIHQPRTMGSDSRPYRHPIGYGDGLWLEVVPTNSNTTPVVVEAYEKYKMLDSLTR